MLCALLALTALAGGDPPPDTLHLDRGKTVTGIILRVDADEVLISEGSRVKSYKMSEVQSMEGPRVAYAEYVQRLRQHFGQADASADDAVALAEWCQEKGLLRDTEFLYLRALCLDQDHEKAREALDHTRRGDGWSVKIGNGGRTTWDKLLERRLEMNEAWELSSFHFDVEAAGPLPDILAAMAEMEQVYAAYFELFQPTVGFHEVQAAIPAHIYPGRDGFPSQSNFLDAYFDRAARSLRSYFTEGLASRIQHETVHAVMYYTAREWDKKEPNLSGWLEEGVATYIDASLDGPPGSLTFEPGKLDEASFRDHRDAEKKDDMTRVLNYQASDFGASTGQVRRYAESYTLTHFLLHGDDGARAEAFSRFLALSYRGQGSMSHFKKALDLRKLDDLEEEWELYVEEHAPKD
ncbi:MAG: DUF1570 domain-containing protein [Planctomycetes bacterium]|nr:DUF1570 domain-containing protein [Planctomycetota bacterium]